MSSRIYFGIWPTSPVVCDTGQILNLSCSTRAKRHREKRGFRFVPLLARAVQDDNMGISLSSRSGSVVGTAQRSAQPAPPPPVQIVTLLRFSIFPSFLGILPLSYYGCRSAALFHYVPCFLFSQDHVQFQLQIPFNIKGAYAPHKILLIKFLNQGQSARYFRGAL